MTDATTAVRWDEFERAAPGLAQRARDALAAHPHHVVATVGPDGAPRVGGTNVYITDGQLWMGMMPSARRIADLRRDPRCALHSAPLDEQLQRPDVRLDLTAVEMQPGRFTDLLQAIGHPDPASAGVGFDLRVRRACVVTVDGDRLVLDTWTPHRGERRSLAG